MKIIRCLRETDFFDIKNGTYHPNAVTVCYGFNNYNSDMEHLNKIAEIIKSEIPNIADKDMRVVYISPKQSIRHAHHTMIAVERNPYEVNARLWEDYDIL